MYLLEIFKTLMNVQINIELKRAYNLAFTCFALIEHLLPAFYMAYWL